MSLFCALLVRFCSISCSVASPSSSTVLCRSFCHVSLMLLMQCCTCESALLNALISFRFIFDTGLRFLITYSTFSFSCFTCGSHSVIHLPSCSAVSSALPAWISICLAMKSPIRFRLSFHCRTPSVSLPSGLNWMAFSTFMISAASAVGTCFFLSGLASILRMLSAYFWIRL